MSSLRTMPPPRKRSEHKVGAQHLLNNTFGANLNLMSLIFLKMVIHEVLRRPPGGCQRSTISLQVRELAFWKQTLRGLGPSLVFPVVSS